jgi:hypothetical protein
MLLGTQTPVFDLTHVEREDCGHSMHPEFAEDTCARILENFGTARQIGKNKTLSNIRLGEGDGTHPKIREYRLRTGTEDQVRAFAIKKEAQNRQIRQTD